ncbi:hypothetical protein BDV95DRAFT_587613 [Massariosphaeria phaeospora]|uniref:Get5 N-terminal domain-containing protein n=1 Tax=Massariosphaeria phaeospora TaxID=100035 RepID=A0A7C8HYJ0_9PLEO|nr:hypothetical protein BDV95DRAFT_587613 [Massariosphaeria phaeospora]
MSELTFCKQYLTALTTRPIKLSSDHIADPRQLPAGGAVRLALSPPSSKHIPTCSPAYLPTHPSNNLQNPKLIPF